jgi:hypothetical protein
MYGIIKPLLPKWREEETSSADGMLGFVLAHQTSRLPPSFGHNHDIDSEKPKSVERAGHALAVTSFVKFSLPKYDA